MCGYFFTMALNVAKLVVSYRKRQSRAYQTYGINDLNRLLLHQELTRLIRASMSALFLDLISPQGRVSAERRVVHRWRQRALRPNGVHGHSAQIHQWSIQLCVQIRLMARWPPGT